MLIYRSKIFARIIVYVVLTMITMSLLIYLGYHEIGPYLIAVTISFVLFILFETEKSYNLYIDTIKISIDSTILFWKSEVNFKIKEIDIVRFGRGSRNESFIIISYHSESFKYGIQGLTRAEAEEIGEHLKKNGCPLVLNLL